MANTISPSLGGISGSDWLNAGSKVLGGLLGGDAPTSSSAYGMSSVDGSHWTVSTGKSSATGGFNLPWYAWAGVVYIAILYFEKKS